MIVTYVNFKLNIRYLSKIIINVDFQVAVKDALDSYSTFFLDF